MKLKSRAITVLILSGLLVFGMWACQTYYFRQNYQKDNALIHETNNLAEKPFLKAHLKDGRVIIMQNNWLIDSLNNQVLGIGTEYDFNRNQLSKGNQKVPIDSVAIFETNTNPVGSGKERILAMTIVTAADLALGIYCLTVPKACFGSCPTFYKNGHQKLQTADAEGFSNAISPSLAYADIDALDDVQSVSGHVQLTMKNEALETHCVKRISMLAVERENGERIFTTPDHQFYRCVGTLSPNNARGPEGNILPLLARPDLKERFSLAHTENLSHKEDLILEFPETVSRNAQGLVLHFRQTLMTTYLIYSGLGYMGDEVGDYMAQLETQPELGKKLENGIWAELGKIEIWDWDKRQQIWVSAGGLYETGPIAVNKQMLPLPESGQKGPRRIKIRLNQGLWRLDYAALTQIKEKVQPHVLPVAQLEWNGAPAPQKLAQLLDPAQLLISLPRDVYQMRFDLPDTSKAYDFFLRSEGYYLEWMRSHWLQDKNLAMLGRMLAQPKNYLKGVAAEYKKYESGMEAQFWSSKVETKNPPVYVP